MANEIKEKDNSQNLYDPDMFNDELSLIDSEIQVIDSLYDEVKNHYDKVKNSPSRGSLAFVEKQTTNLVNLKTAKLNYIKQRIDVKKVKADFKYKDKQIDIKQSTNETNNGLSESILNKIMESFGYDAKKINESSRKLSNIDETDIDLELEEALDESDIEMINNISGITNNEVDEEETNEVIISEEEDIYVYDKENNKFYKLNSDYEIEEDLGSNFDDIVSFYKDEESDELYALGDSDNIYLCISLEEE